MSRALLLALAAALLAGPGCATRRGPTTVAEAQALLARDLPVGTPCARALAWLDERTIEHSARTPAPPPAAGPAVIYAAIRNVRRTAVVETTLLLELRCDRQTDRLVAVDVREGHTGP
jgi:hypothetical protein